METQIFYWTGVVIWWGLCLLCIGGVVTLVIITPLWAFGKSKLGWWRWVTVAKFADLGWTNEELKKVLTRAHIDDKKFFDTAVKVIEAGKQVKASR